MVYSARQCDELRPTDGPLCKGCIARRDAPPSATCNTVYACWQGIVTDMASLPATSHIAGSAWFLSGKPKWIGVEQPARSKAVRSKTVTAPAPAPAPAESESGEFKYIDGDFYWVHGRDVYSYDQIEDKQGALVGRLTRSGDMIEYPEAAAAEPPSLPPATLPLTLPATLPLPAAAAATEPPSLPPAPEEAEFEAPPSAVTAAKPSRRALRRAIEEGQRALEEERAAHEATKAAFAALKASYARIARLTEVLSSEVSEHI